MTQKMTKAQRIEAKLDEGMSHYEAEIAVVEQDAAETLSRLRAKQAQEEARVRERMVELLKTEHPDVHAELLESAKYALASEAQDRSRRVSAARAAAKAERSLAAVPQRPQSDQQE